MGYRLYREVVEYGPSDLSLGEFVVWTVIADDANDDTRTGWIASDALCRRSRMTRSAVVKNLQRLAARGYELRVPRGTDRLGREVFAYRGTQSTYRLPALADAKDGRPSTQSTRERVDDGAPIVEKGWTTVRERVDRRPPLPLNPLNLLSSSSARARLNEPSKPDSAAPPAKPPPSRQRSRPGDPRSGHSPPCCNASTTTSCATTTPRHSPRQPHRPKWNAVQPRQGAKPVPTKGLSPSRPVQPSHAPTASRPRTTAPTTMKGPTSMPDRRPLTSVTLALDDMLMRPAEDRQTAIAAELRSTAPAWLLDQLDAAATEVRIGMDALGAVDVPARTMPGWLRLGALQAVVDHVSRRADTCIHSPNPMSPQPVAAAAWKPGLVVCRQCTQLLRLPRNSTADGSCDGCGRPCAGVDAGDPIYPGAVQVGALVYSFGACTDCLPESKSTGDKP